jgi:hypothetical protein
VPKEKPKKRVIESLSNPKVKGKEKPFDSMHKQ